MTSVHNQAFEYTVLLLFYPLSKLKTNILKHFMLIKHYLHLKLLNYFIDITWQNLNKIYFCSIVIDDSVAAQMILGLVYKMDLFNKILIYILYGLRKTKRY